MTMITKQGQTITNPRRIPVEGSFINYDSNDIMYSLMYANATYNPEEKRLYLPKTAYTQMRKIFRDVAGITDSKMRQRHLTKLKEKDLISEDKTNYYYI